MKNICVCVFFDLCRPALENSNVKKFAVNANVTCEQRLSRDTAPISLAGSVFVLIGSRVFHVPLMLHELDWYPDQERLSAENVGHLLGRVHEYNRGETAV